LCRGEPWVAAETAAARGSDECGDKGKPEGNRAGGSVRQHGRSATVAPTGL